jgi:hypothetical protein
LPVYTPAPAETRIAFQCRSGGQKGLVNRNLKNIMDELRELQEIPGNFNYPAHEKSWLSPVGDDIRVGDLGTLLNSLNCSDTLQTQTS